VGQQGPPARAAASAVWALRVARGQGTESRLTLERLQYLKQVLGVP